ncbi:hypothetical protein [Streptomyces sp. NPDC050504]|uniref:hypothetical protein n=1 Tax=Streptomyces sp. NPDC050504 TaxID=3365618 RepID=UPI0037882FA7
MADERYEWLDKETAERLLNGDPVNAADDHTGAEAARLAGTLDALRAPHPAADTAELPGEAAALAAFRAHRADAVRTPAGTAAGTAGTTAGTAATGARAVRTGGARRARGPRWGRPMRFGLAASLAGVALGGVAVAAGTGVLPGLPAPFGSHADPAPASSVSAAQSPGPVVSEAPTGGHGSALPTRGPTASAAPEPTPSGPPDEEPDPEDGDEEQTGQGGGSGGEREHPDDDTTRGPYIGDWYRKTLKACREYRAGTLDRETRQNLDAAAKGPDRVGRFCDALLNGGGGNGGRGNGGQGPGGGHGGNGSGGNGNGGNGGSEGDGGSGNGGDGNGGSGGDGHGGDGHDGDGRPPGGSGPGPGVPDVPGAGDPKPSARHHPLPRAARGSVECPAPAVPALTRR